MKTGHTLFLLFLTFIFSDCKQKTEPKFPLAKYQNVVQFKIYFDKTKCPNELDSLFANLTKPDSKNNSLFDIEINEKVLRAVLVSSQKNWRFAQTNQSEEQLLKTNQPEKQLLKMKEEHVIPIECVSFYTIYSELPEQKP